MIPVKLTLQNFLSYGDQAQTLDFTGFHVACLSGSNGHGKSALLDAMTWALWGQARKGRHDRKPDEGLLRLGARQMRVEFTFELDDGTHRVIRSFRRRPSSNITELELQIFDAEAGVYRPLSEAGATSTTQARINRLLSMDYDTFTNSAFLLQGQANAFTSKGSRERKQLLARVLGLERFDRLQEGARSRQQTQSAELTSLRQQCSSLADELSLLPKIEQDLAQTQKALADADAEVKRFEDKLQLWRERRLRADSLRGEDERLRQDLLTAEASCRRLDEDSTQLLRLRDADAELLSQSDRIEADAVRRQHLQKELAQCQAQQQAVQSTEVRCAEVQRQIDAARHLVEQRRVTWEARRDSLDERLRRFEQVLEDAERIEAAHARLAEQRGELDRLRRKRRRWEELRSHRATATHEIELEERRITERQRGNRARLQEIQLRIAGAAELSRQIELAENELESAGKRAEQMRKLREDGTGVRAQLDQARQRLAEVDTQRAELAERIAALGRGDLTECPLCGTDLDGEHRQRIDAELGEHEAGLAAQHAQLSQEISVNQERLEVLGSRFRDLEQAAADLAGLQEQVALLRARRRQLNDDEQAAAGVLTEISELTELLQRQGFAPEARTAVTDADAALTVLAFDPERLAQLEQQLRDGATIDTEYQLLQGARQDREQTHAERLQAQSHVQAAQDELTTGAFARVLEGDLQQLRDEQIAVGYDPLRHEQVSHQLTELADAPVLADRLATARQRSQTTEASLQRLQAEIGQAEQRKKSVALRLQELATALHELANVEAGCADASQQLELQRQQRDALLERRGSLAARQQQLTAQAEQFQQLQETQQTLQRQHWLYSELAEAFGKDGIQALVIESAIPEIEDEANAILRRLTNNRIQVTIESLRDLKGGGSRETLDVKIADELGERPYDLYSGGEAFRTDFALRIALSKVLARRAGTRLRTLIIDEGFGTQDAEGLEQMTEAIHQISRDFDKVLIVTHLDELKDAFPVRIEVTKDPDRGSHFEVVS